MKAGITILVAAVITISGIAEATAASFVNVNVKQQRRGLFGQRSNTNVNVNGVNVNVQNRGLLGRQTVTNVSVPRNQHFNGFNNNNVNVFVDANGRVHRRNSNVNVAVAANGFNFNNAGIRVNAFGTRTVVDANGNVFEVDAFGNSVFRGSAFRGFGQGYGGGISANVGYGYYPGINSFGFSGTCH